jgi:hypothetical protein
VGSGCDVGRPGLWGEAEVVLPGVSSWRRRIAVQRWTAGRSETEVEKISVLIRSNLEGFKCGEGFSAKCYLF